MLLCSDPELCMASAWFRQALTTDDIPLKALASSSAKPSARLQTFFRASKAYRRTLKLWLKHDCRMTSRAFCSCAALNTERRRVVSGNSWWKSRFEKNQTKRSLTFSLICGIMTLKCIRTDRNVHTLVLVRSWSWKTKWKLNVLCFVSVSSSDN